MTRTLPLLLLLACAPKGGVKATADVPRDDAAWLDLLRLHGPFRDAAAACVYARAQEARSSDALLWCGEAPAQYGSVEGPTSLPPRGAWKGVGLLPVHDAFSEEARDDVGWGGERLHLALQTSRGVFAGPALAQLWNPGAFGVHDQFVVEELAYDDVIPGGEPEVWLRFVHDRSDTNMGAYEVWEDRQEALVICALGPGAVPACSEPVPLGAHQARLPIAVDATTTAEELGGEPYFRRAWTSTIERGPGWLGLHPGQVPPLGEEDPRLEVVDEADVTAPPMRSLVPRITREPVHWPKAEPEPDSDEQAAPTAE